MASAPPHVTSSPELLALTKQSRDLCNGITRVSTVTSFALSLEQKGLITSDAKSSILNTLGISDLDKCTRLLDAVREQVGMDPAKFESFVGIFRREPALSSHTNMLLTTRGELQVKMCTLLLL